MKKAAWRKSNFIHDLLENSKVTQAVSDNGIGIHEAYFGKIFKPFERLHGRSAFEGSGIGLAICEKAVKKHNGEISVQNNQPQGTIFTITLPERQNQN